MLAQTTDPTGKPRTIYPPFLTIAGPGSSGYALFPVDGDGRVRRFDERLGEKGEVVPTLAGQMAQRMGTEPQHGLIDFAIGPRFDYVPFHRAGSVAPGPFMTARLAATSTAFSYAHPLFCAPCALVGRRALNVVGSLLSANAPRNQTIAGGDA